MSFAFLSFVSVAATVASVGMLTAPMLTVLGLLKARSIGVLTITFFCAQYMNCFVWTMYGMQKGALPVIICNSIGLAIATYCNLVFLTVARSEEKTRLALRATTYRCCLITAVGILSLCVVFFIVTLVLKAVAGYAVSLTVNGIAGGFCSIFMLSSPLGMARDIIRNKNAEGLQPVTMAFATANSVLWTLYGILVYDVYIALPNGICTLACLFQFALLFRYGRHPIAQNTVVIESQTSATV